MQLQQLEVALVALELGERYGTREADNLLGAADTILFGLQGADVLRSAPSSDYQVLLGGTGNDTYRIGSGHAVVVADSAGVDRLEIGGLPFGSDFSLVAEIDGRHIGAFNTQTGTTVYWLDFRQSSIMTVSLSDATLTRDQLADQLFSLEGFEGRLSWEDVAQLGFDVPTTDVANATYDAAIARAVELEQIVAGPRLSMEQAQTVAYLYEAGLDRDGNIDLPGLNFWIDRREDGLSERQLSRAFLESREFETAFGDAFDQTSPDYLTNRELVEQLYRNVLNREGEVRGVDFWTGLVSQPNFTRADLLLAFAESPENVAGSPFVETLAEAAPGEWEFVA